MSLAVTIKSPFSAFPVLAVDFVYAVSYLCVGGAAAGTAFAGTAVKLPTAVPEERSGTLSSSTQSGSMG